jgi:hypothetical protein
MQLLRRKVTTALGPVPVPPGVTLALAVDTAVTQLARAVRSYAQAGGPDDATPGVRLTYAEQLVFDELTTFLVAVHAQLDDIHGPGGMTMVERKHDLLLGQVLAYFMPKTMVACADAAVLRGDDVTEAVFADVDLVSQWALDCGTAALGGEA